jgi:phosphoribosylamine--glycine ligase
MNIFIIGGDDGSCMLSALLLEDPTVNKIYHYGTHKDAIATDRYIPLNLTPWIDFENERSQILNFIDTLDIDLIIPIVLLYMLWDDLQIKIKTKNIPCLGPSKEIAMLEWSKILGKGLLTQLGIPTPEYSVYNLENLIKEFPNIKRPFVFKYDKDDRVGLQTVIVTDNTYQEEYELLKTTGHTRVGFCKTVLGPYFKPNFIVESFVEGVREYSYHVICNGVNWQYIGSARDYKKRFDDDVGFNTVGLGAYANVEINPIVHTYVDKILNHLKENGKEWIGIMYLGIMEDANGTPHVLEINTRLGNPELQVILPLINNNLKTLFYDTASNKQINAVSFNNQSAVTLRIIHKSYPYLPTDVKSINPIFPKSSEVCINYPIDRLLFNASIVGLANSVNEASDKIYNYLKDIDLNDFTYRKDIGYLK